MMRKLLILLMLLIVTQLSGQLSVNSTNSNYLDYNGSPIYLLTSGEHYGAILNLEFDYDIYLGLLEDHNFNMTRIQSGINVEFEGWYDISDNVWAPGPNEYITPWARSATSGYYNGGNKFDLDTWDDAYFTRLHDFMAKAAAAGIIVEFTFFSTVYNYHSGDTPAHENWWYNVMEYDNNVNGVGNYDNDGVYDITNDLWDYQEAVVVKIVTELNEYLNILWEPINEPYINPGPSNPWTDEFTWEDAITDVIVTTEAGLTNQHLISRNLYNFGFDISSLTPVNSDISVWNFHYTETKDMYEDNVPNGYVVGVNETGRPGRQEDYWYRQEAYLNAFNGGGLFNHLDYSITVGDETGTNLPEGNPSGGTPELRDQLTLLASMMSSFDFIDMAPDTTYIASVSSDVHVYSIMEAGEQYGVFFKGVTSFVQMTLPEDTYSVEWIDTKSGSITASAITHSGGTKVLYPPSYTEDISLRILKAVPEVPDYTVRAATRHGAIVTTNGAMVAHQQDVPTETPPDEEEGTIVFEGTITMVYTPIATGGYGFYWWHRPDEESITEFGDMPVDDWSAYDEGIFTMELLVVDQPTTEPFYMQFGIWQDYGDPDYPETVASRQYVSGGDGSGGTWVLGSPDEWWQKEPGDPVDFSRADDFFRIGVVLWHVDPLCIPKGAAWGDDGCPEYESDFFPLEIYVKITAQEE